MTDPKNITVANLAKPDLKEEQIAAVASAMNIPVEREDDEDEVPQAAAPPPEPPKTPRKHPASLVRLALRFGARREAIDQASTSDLAEWIDEQEIQRARRQEMVREPEVQPQRTAKPTPPDDDSIDWGTDELGNPIEESQILPGLRNVIKAQHKKIKELEGGQKQIAERERERSVSTSFERIEDAFASLPANLQKLFGTGTLAECTNDEKMRRNAALGAAGIDFGKVPPARVIAQKLQAVSGALFNLKAAPTEPEAEANPYEALANQPGKTISPATFNGKKRLTEQDMEAGTLSRVTHRETEEPKGRKKAAIAVAQKMRETGMSTNDFDSFDMDDMP